MNAELGLNMNILFILILSETRVSLRSSELLIIDCDFWFVVSLACGQVFRAVLIDYVIVYGAFAAEGLVLV